MADNVPFRQPNHGDVPDGFEALGHGPQAGQFRQEV
jgi:hypothetical protein